MLLAHDIDGAGDRDPVVLLHSAVCDRRMWTPQWTPLIASGRRVLRCDFRGFGDSPAPVAPYSNAEDVVGLLDEYGLDRVALVGASFGGRVSQEVAARWPDRVSRLVLLCAARRGHPPTAAIQAFAEREDELLEAGDVDAATALNVETFLGPAADPATRELVAQMQRHAFALQLAAPEIAGAEHEVDLADIAARTLVVSGGQDLDYFGEIAEILTTGIAGSRHVVLDWAGHLPSLEDPDRLNPLLLEFLAD